MSTQIHIKKMNKELRGLKDDVREMKRFLFAPMKDPEGEYSSYFVKKMLARLQSKGPFYRFRGRESFLKHVRTKRQD